MGPFGYPNLLAVVTFVVAGGALAQGTGPRPPNPLLQNAPQVPLLSNPAQDTYAECVRRKQDEMVRYGQATQVRDLIDHRERYIETLRMNPQMAKQYPGGIDQAIAEAFRSYPAAHDLWQASVRVSLAVERRDELGKAGERMNWGGSTRENFQRSERDVADFFARYKALGGTARAAEDVTRGEQPCRDERRQLDAAVRAAYPGEPSPITQSRSMPVPSGSVPSPAGSVPVPSGNAPNRSP